MSTDLILSTNRFFEEIYPSAKEDAQCLAILSLDKPELKMLPTEQPVIKLHKGMPHCKNKIPPKAESGIPNPNIISAVNLNQY